MPRNCSKEGACPRPKFASDSDTSSRLACKLDTVARVQMYVALGDWCEDWLSMTYCEGDVDMHDKWQKISSFMKRVTYSCSCIFMLCQYGQFTFPARLLDQLLS